MRQQMCGRQNNAPALIKVHILIPRTCEYAVLHGKRDVAKVIKVTDLKIQKLS